MYSFIVCVFNVIFACVWLSVYFFSKHACQTVDIIIFCSVLHTFPYFYVFPHDRKFSWQLLQNICKIYTSTEINFVSSGRTKFRDRFSIWRLLNYLCKFTAQRRDDALSICFVGPVLHFQFFQFHVKSLYLLLDLNTDLWAMAALLRSQTLSWTIRFFLFKSSSAALFSAISCSRLITS